MEYFVPDPLPCPCACVASGPTAAQAHPKLLVGETDVGFAVVGDESDQGIDGLTHGVLSMRCTQNNWRLASQHHQSGKPK